MADRYSVTRSIEAPVEHLWALLTDPAEQLRWNATLQSIEGDIVEGGVVSRVSTINPKRTFKLKVSDVAAPNRMTWSDGMPLGLFKGVRTFELWAKDGSTEFTMTEAYSGLMAGLITRSIPDMTESFEQYADSLKAAAESSS